MAVKLQVVLPSSHATQEQIEEIVWLIYNKLEEERESNPNVKEWMTGKPIVQHYEYK
jgi:hypothetical protein